MEKKRKTRIQTGSGEKLQSRKVPMFPDELIGKKKLDGRYADQLIEYLEELDASGLPDNEALRHLKNIKHLNLYFHKFIHSLPESIFLLSRLESLTLSGCKISYLPPEIKALKKLCHLSLSYCPISSLPPEIGQLSQLTSLDLSKSQVSALPDEICNLEHLVYLQLGKTKIKKLPEEIGGLPRLRMLDISNLHLHHIPLSLVKKGMDFTFSAERHSENGYIFMQGLSLENQPISLFEQPIELILEYYRNHDVVAGLEKEGNPAHIPLREAKVVFLGDGGVGKTYTIRRILAEGEPGDYDTKATPGVEIQDYRVEIHDYDVQNKDFQIHFWDFGGQANMRSMHRCFLTERTCYVVMVSNRYSNIRHQARYWLKNIESFAQESAVILAVNQWNNVNIWDLNIRELQQEFPNLKIHVPYTATTGEKSEFDMLIKAISDEVLELTGNGDQIPDGWAQIGSELKEIKKPYITQDDYHEICRRYNILPDIGNHLLEWFNVLGVCFSYHQNREDRTELAQYKILNPTWLTNAIYIIITCGREKAEKGVIRHADIQEILDHPTRSVHSGIRYSPEERDYVLQIMRKFRLSYKVEENKEFIPALCMDDLQDECVPTDYQYHSEYRMTYKYLPDTVIHQLMIACYKDLNMSKLWQRGLRIDARWCGLSAVIKMDGDDKYLTIDLYSKGEPTWRLLQALRKTLLQINRSLNLAAEEEIIIRNGDIVQPFLVTAILDAKEKGVNQVPGMVGGSYQLYAIDDVLGAAFSQDAVDTAVTAVRKENKDNNALSLSCGERALVHIENYYQQNYSNENYYDQHQDNRINMGNKNTIIKSDIQ